jgi:hypothetical protein
LIVGNNKLFNNKKKKIGVSIIEIIKLSNIICKFYFYFNGNILITLLSYYTHTHTHTHIYIPILYNCDSTNLFILKSVCYYYNWILTMR